MASEESKEGQSLLKSSNKLDTESECNVMTKLKLIKYKCDHYSFEAKSARGLKTHIGYKHKDQAKFVEYTPKIQIYICLYMFKNHKYNTTVFHCVAQRSTLLHWVPLCSTVSHCVTLCFKVFHSVPLCSRVVKKEKTFLLFSINFLCFNYSNNTKVIKAMHVFHC